MSEHHRTSQNITEHHITSHHIPNVISQHHHTAISNLNLAHVHCLSFLHPDLEADIYISTDTLTHATKRFQAAIAPASPETTPSTLSLLLTRQTPMGMFCNVLQDCPAACDWTPFMNAGRPPLKAIILLCQMLDVWRTVIDGLHRG